MSPVRRVTFSWTQPVNCPAVALTCARAEIVGKRAWIGCAIEHALRIKINDEQWAELLLTIEAEAQIRSLAGGGK